MARVLDRQRFNDVYEGLICQGVFNESPDYYRRYRSRYEVLLQKYCQLAPQKIQSVLDIGGGQLGLLCKALWDDDAYVLDIGGLHWDYLRSQGLTVQQWNLCIDEPPFVDQFDLVFFSEVIEHLPLPGHVVLAKLKLALHPTGLLICSTPNLYRLRNVVYMLLGKQIYDYFRMPEDCGLGHVLEYSRDHLQWQLERAGFANCQVEYRQLHHWPNNLWFRLLYALGYPLFLVPRFRDNLIAIAQGSVPPPA